MVRKKNQKKKKKNFNNTYVLFNYLFAINLLKKDARVQTKNYAPSKYKLMVHVFPQLFEFCARTIYYFEFYSVHYYFNITDKPALTITLS